MVYRHKCVESTRQRQEVIPDVDFSLSQGRRVSLHTAKALKSKVLDLLESVRCVFFTVAGTLNSKLSGLLTV